MLACGPGRGSEDGHLDGVVREGFDARFTRHGAVFEVCPQKGGGDTDCVEYGGSDEVVPGGEAEVAVDEEEDEEEGGHDEVEGFEEFVEAVSECVSWEGPDENGE